MPRGPLGAPRPGAISKPVIVFVYEGPEDVDKLNEFRSVLRERARSPGDSTDRVWNRVTVDTAGNIKFTARNSAVSLLEIQQTERVVRSMAEGFDISLIGGVDVRCS